MAALPFKSSSDGASASVPDCCGTGVLEADRFTRRTSLPSARRYTSPADESPDDDALAADREFTTPAGGALSLREQFALDSLLVDVNGLPVAVTTTNGTATAGSDYVSKTGTLTWLADDTRPSSSICSTRRAALL